MHLNHPQPRSTDSLTPSLSLLSICSFRMLLMRSTATREGEEYMRYDELSILSPSTMVGSTTVVHEITESSPLHGMTQDYIASLTSAQFQLVVTIVGLDSKFSSEISAMKKYKPTGMWIGRVRVGGCKCGCWCVCVCERELRELCD